MWSTIREIVPTVEQAGIDEGYLDLGEVAPDFDDARALAEAVQTSVRAATSLSCSLGVATSKVVAKVASRPPQAGRPHGRAPGQGGGVPRAVPDPHPAGRRAARRSGSSPSASRRSARSPRSTTTSCGGLLRGKVGRVLRDRARGIDRRTLEVSTERISISDEETFERDIADPERLHDELRRMAVKLAEHLRGRGMARTVTTKVRYPDFSIRTRSTSLPVGTDDGERIGELACSLLDRALRDRPGPLRLVGVGVSGLEEHMQLSFPAVV